MDKAVVWETAESFGVRQRLFFGGSHSRMGYGLSVLLGYAEMALILPARLFPGVKTLALVPWKSCRRTSLMPVRFIGFGISTIHII